MLSVYLEYQFKEFVDYQFTSSMEVKLDEIATGQADWKDVVKEFWDTLNGSVEHVRRNLF